MQQEKDNFKLVMFGIGNRDSNTVIDIKESITESFDSISDKSDMSIAGTNINDDANRLKSIVPEDDIDRQTDAYIHDFIKSRKSTKKLHVGETKHILDVITHPELPTHDLYNKWQHFVHVHSEKRDQTHKDLNSMYVTEHDLDSMDKAGYNPHIGRVFQHKRSKHFFELNYDGSLNYIGDHKSEERNSIIRYYNVEHILRSDNPENLSKTLSKDVKRHSDKINHEPMIEYTMNSSHLNTVLHKKATGQKDIESTGDEFKHKFNSAIELADSLSNQIEKHPHSTNLPDFHVYAGTYTSFNPPTNSQEDFLYHSPSFTSTSIHKDVAISFAKRKIVNNKEVHDVLKIKVPSHFAHGMFIKDFSQHPEEEEYLIDRDQKYRVKPNPNYLVHTGGDVYRVWNTELHPREDTELFLDFKHKTRQNKINVVTHPDVDRQTIYHALSYARENQDHEIANVIAKTYKFSAEEFHNLSNVPDNQFQEHLHMNQHMPKDVIENSLNNIKNVGTKIGLSKRTDLDDAQKQKLQTAIGNLKI